MDPNLQVYESEARENAKPDLGPVCYDCGKPSRLDGKKTRGGCECPPRPLRESQVTQATTTADRQLFALEKIAAYLGAYLAHNKIAVPDVLAPVGVGPAGVPITGTPIDALRQKAKVG